jgi:hypothetical protein
MVGRDRPVPVASSGRVSGSLPRSVASTTLSVDSAVTVKDLSARRALFHPAHRLRYKA